LILAGTLRIPKVIVDPAHGFDLTVRFAQRK